MKKFYFKFLIIVLIGINFKVVQAQRTTEVGLTGSMIRYYPNLQVVVYPNNRMENSFGWSAGVFIQEKWKPKITQIVELNYYH